MRLREGQISGVLGENEATSGLADELFRSEPTKTPIRT